MKKIIRRILAVIPAVLVQVLWIVLLMNWLAPWAAVIELVLAILSLLFVLYMITKRGEGTYKMLWLLVIMAFPLAGALLYLIFGTGHTTRPLQKKLNKVQELALQPSGETGELDEEAPRLAQTFRYVERMTGFPVCENQEADYFPLGDDMFPSILKDLEKAEKYIFLEYFIVEHGVMLDNMVDILARKVKEGVDVRFMYDDLGSLSTFSAEDVRKLQEKGIHCISFNPMVFLKGTLNYRDHRKMLIIDGKVAYSGGVNLADEYINRYEKYGHWKDVGLRLTGPAVQNYTLMFLRFWNAFSEEPIQSGEREGSICLEDLELKLTASGKLEEAEREPKAKPKADKERTPEVQKTDGYVLSYYDSPLGEQAVSNELYIELLSQAKKYAYFYTPYLLLGDALLDAFVRAAHRGVDVRIFMPGIPDKKLVFRMSHSFYPVLLEAGVKIYEYIPGFLHAKGCIIDDVVGTVGTVNLDYRSLYLHFENNSLFYKASILQDIKADFLDTQSKSREMILGENVKLTFWSWIFDGVLRIFAPLC